MADPELDDLIADATADAHDMEEQLMGFFDRFVENLAVPFKTTILGMTVTVEGVGYDGKRFCGHDHGRTRPQIPRGGIGGRGPRRTPTIRLGTLFGCRRRSANPASARRTARA